jgi:hypothetical protein
VDKPRGAAWGGERIKHLYDIIYIIFLRILNSGSYPSVVIDYEVQIISGDTTITTRIRRFEKLVFDRASGSMELLDINAIYKLTEQPVQAGGMVNGHIIFSIRKSDEKLVTPGARIMFRFQTSKETEHP